MVTLDLKVSLATLGTLEKMVTPGNQVSLGFREVRDFLGILDPLESQVKMGNLEPRACRENQDLRERRVWVVHLVQKEEKENQEFLENLEHLVQKDAKENLVHPGKTENLVHPDARGSPE